MEMIARRGRVKGIRLITLTQRPASIEDCVDDCYRFPAITHRVETKLAARAEVTGRLREKGLCGRIVEHAVRAALVRPTALVQSKQILQKLGVRVLSHRFETELAVALEQARRSTDGAPQTVR